jgi:hypothetical protein
MNKRLVIALTVALAVTAAAQAPTTLPGGTYTIHSTSSTKADDGPMASAMAAAMPNGPDGWTGVVSYAANRGR